MKDIREMSTDKLVNKLQAAEQSYTHQDQNTEESRQACNDIIEIIHTISDELSKRNVYTLSIFPLDSQHKHTHGSPNDNARLVM
jgi:hypothetical protein